MSILGLEVTMSLINHLVDAGHKEEISVIEEKVADGTLFPYLSEKYNVVNLNNFPRQAEAEKYLQNWFNTYSGSDYRRKFAVENNGLNLLVAALIFS
ncbi:hypothetical protein NYE67_10925 [Solibacillus sp. FSL W8-0474]|uniref:hypothetical protein n=1 Tax=Solibacillus sp. FSL W8-0474 TaxID=2975336 RepID=UPI0030F8AC53